MFCVCVHVKVFALALQDTRISGKRDECIPVMRPRRLHNREQPVAENHAKRMANLANSTG